MIRSLWGSAAIFVPNNSISFVFVYILEPQIFLERFHHLPAFVYASMILLFNLLSLMRPLRHLRDSTRDFVTFQKHVSIVLIRKCHVEISQVISFQICVRNRLSNPTSNIFTAR